MGAQRILVIGGGIAGLATAWSLARRGARDVVVLERETGLGRHATAQNAAILRTPCDDVFVELLARESAAFLRSPPRGFCSTPLVEERGLILIGRRRSPEVSEGSAGWESRIAARDDVEELTPQRLSALAPHARWTGQGAFHLAREGRIDTTALMRAFESGARSLGVVIETGASVAEILTRGGSVCGVRLACGREIRAERTVIAAGAWAALLGRDIGSKVELLPTRRHLLVTQPDARIDPAWPVLWNDADPFYARPEGGGLLVCACDETPVDPDRLSVQEEEKGRALEKASQHLHAMPALDLARFWAGIRTLSGDGRFVIGPDADVVGLDWVAGLGGHGMTCAAAAGRLAADLILDGVSDDPIARAMSPARFSVRSQSSTAPARIAP